MDFKIEDVLFGTVDSWLIWKLTGGATHATDCTNASRTLLFDIRKREWDPELCELLGIPMHMLPEVKNSLDDYGRVETIASLSGRPILGVAGDQQAALFGQTCFAAGQIKNTYGTGCFVVMNTGKAAIESQHGLVTTVAVDGDGGPCFALEGSIFIAGAAIQWLRDLGVLERSSDSEQAALAVEDNGGVFLVPAFVGLGAPHLDRPGGPQRTTESELVAGSERGQRRRGRSRRPDREVDRVASVAGDRDR